MIKTLSLMSGLLSCASMTTYFYYVTRGQSQPNPATWIVWLIVGVLNAVTYFQVVDGSLLRSLALIIVTSGILAVTVYASLCGKFARLQLIDLVCLAFAVGVGILWRMNGNPVLANLLLQSVYVISFIPTVLGLHRGEIRERPWPWLLALGSYSLIIVSIGLTWHSGSWVALVHPILNGLLGNGIVAIYALWPRQSSSRLQLHQDAA